MAKGTKIGSKKHLKYIDRVCLLLENCSIPAKSLVECLYTQESVWPSDHQPLLDLRKSAKSVQTSIFGTHLNLTNPPLVVVVGQVSSGKSTLINHVLYGDRSWIYPLPCEGNTCTASLTGVYCAGNSTLPDHGMVYPIYEGSQPTRDIPRWKDEVHAVLLRAAETDSPELPFDEYAKKVADNVQYAEFLFAQESRPLKNLGSSLAQGLLILDTPGIEGEE